MCLDSVHALLNFVEQFQNNYQYIIHIIIIVMMHCTSVIMSFRALMWLGRLLPVVMRLSWSDAPLERALLYKCCLNSIKNKKQFSLSLNGKNRQGSYCWNFIKDDQSSLLWLNSHPSSQETCEQNILHIWHEQSRWEDVNRVFSMGGKVTSKKVKLQFWI